MADHNAIIWELNGAYYDMLMNCMPAYYYDAEDTDDYVYAWLAT